MSSMQKCLVSFPKAQQDFRIGGGDEPVSYLDYLLELADRLFRGKANHDADRSR